MRVRNFFLSNKCFCPFEGTNKWENPPQVCPVTFMLSETMMNNNTTNLVQQVQPNIGVYAFDDLLVACSQEIMTNGIESPHVPSTIRDWLAGTLVQMECQWSFLCVVRQKNVKRVPYFSVYVLYLID